MSLSSAPSEVSGYDVRHSYGIEFKYGLMFVHVIDYPNEAEVLLVNAWGLGFSPWFGWAVPWRINKEAI